MRFHLSVGSCLSRPNFFAVFTLQRFGAYWPRRREQISLAKRHAGLEYIGRNVFGLDALGDQIDTKTAEHAGEIGRISIGLGEAIAAEQERRRRLDEAEATSAHFAPVELQIDDVVHGEAEAAVGKDGKTL